MFTPRTVLAAAALTTAAALTPAPAFALDDSTYDLNGSPHMTKVDETHAKLYFTADRLPEMRSGKPDAGITMALDGVRVSNIRRDGKHGDSLRYVATVTSERAMRMKVSYRLSFRLGDDDPVARTAQLKRPRTF